MLCARIESDEKGRRNKHYLPTEKIKNKNVKKNCETY